MNLAHPDNDNYKSAAVYLELNNISGDTMIAMDNNLDNVPKDKIGSFYLHDLMAGFVEYLIKNN